jgi:hypothetical protein
MDGINVSCFAKKLKLNLVIEFGRAYTLIIKSLMSYIEEIFIIDEETLIRSWEPIFMYDGMPTEAYKKCLLEITQYILTADSQVRQTLLNFLMRCEEGVYLPITGIISIKAKDPEFYGYVRVLKAIYGESCAFMDKEKAYICNSVIVNMIQQLEAGCKYYPCYRNNKLHKECMHTQLKF